MTMRIVHLLNRLMTDLDQHVRRRLNNDIVVGSKVAARGARLGRGTRLGMPRLLSR